MSVSKSFLVCLVLGVASLHYSCGDSAKTPADSSVAPQTKPSSELMLLSIHPEDSVVGEVFNAQPDGQAAMAVKCSGATNKAVIVFADQELKTVFGGSALLSAQVPRNLYAKAGAYSVYIKDGAIKSNSKTFTVLKNR